MPIKIIVAPHRSTSSQGHTRSKYLPLDQVTGSSMVSSKVESMWLWFSFYYKRYIYPELHDTFIIVFLMLIFGCLGFEFQAYNQIFNMFSFKYHIGFRYCVVLVLQCTAWCSGIRLSPSWTGMLLTFRLIISKSAHRFDLRSYAKPQLLQQHRKKQQCLGGFLSPGQDLMHDIYIYIFTYTYVHVYVYIQYLDWELFESGDSFTILSKYVLPSPTILSKCKHEVNAIQRNEW